TPAAPDGSAPALKDLPEPEHDWLFRIAPHAPDQPPRYYGHPNPEQHHYVLNGGNPTPGPDFAEVPQYPVGTKPDPMRTPAVHDRAYRTQRLPILRPAVA